LSLSHDDPSSDAHYALFEERNVLARLKALDARLNTPETAPPDPDEDRLVRIAMARGATGPARGNGHAVFDPSRNYREHPEWLETIQKELEEIRAGVRDAQGARLRFLIWCGVGSAAEDKWMYNAVGLLKRSPRCYVLDSTDPAKLRSILEDLVRRSGLRLADALRSTLVVGMTTGPAARESALNLEKLAALYRKHGVDSRPNFLCMTPPGSLLEKFARAHRCRAVDVNLGGMGFAAGQCGGPLSRGSLYPLGLSKVDLAAWCDGACLSDTQILTAWRLAAFLQAQTLAGRDKITLVLPKPWAGAGQWLKHCVENLAGKSENPGLKIILEGKIKLANYRSPKDPMQDRAFLALKLRGLPAETPDKIGKLRRSGYPVATVTLPRGTMLSSFMQFIHYMVFGLAWLRDADLVSRSGVKYWQQTTERLFKKSQDAGGVEKLKEWKSPAASSRRVRHRGCVTLCYDRLKLDIDAGGLDAPTTYALLLKKLLAEERVDHAGLVFFGDTRYSARGRSLLKTLNRSAERLFRARLKMPVDICEGPEMNHSHFEAVTGHGKCFTTVILSEKAERLPAAGHTAQYHMAQYLATQMTLAEGGHPVVSILLKDLEEPTLTSLEDLFRQAGISLKSIKP